MHSSNLHITQLPAISAIYFGLLTSGYDYSHFERNDSHVAALNSFRNAMPPHPFFLQTRQSTCDVYPFWPRAAMLETATFYLADNYENWQNRESFRQDILQAVNITNPERDESFWMWIDHFPDVMQHIMRSPHFTDYLQWEQRWILAQNQLHTESLYLIEKTLHRCQDLYHSSVHDIQLLLNPVKCVYSADYHLVDKRFVFTSGRMQTESVIHEFLHHVVHPYVSSHREDIMLHPCRFPGLDDSYYSAGHEYAFEEYLVRRLTQLASENSLPRNLPAFLCQLLYEHAP